MAPNTVAPQAPDELPKDALAAMFGKAPAVPDFLKETAPLAPSVSEPPTLRLPELYDDRGTDTKRSDRASAGDAASVSGQAVDASAAASVEAKEGESSAELSEPLAKSIPGVVTGRLDHSRSARAKSQRAASDVAAAKPAEARSVAQAADAGRPDAPTRPPSRPHRAAAAPREDAKLPWGAILLGILVLGGGVFAGMKLVGMKLDGTHREPARHVAEPTLASATGSSGTAGAPSGAFAAIDEALEAGDVESARTQLDRVPVAERASLDYRRLEILVEATQIDLLWWQARLAPESGSERVEARLADLEAHLTSCRANEDCKGATQPAYWALWRMRGQVAHAERPTQGTVDANGLYQLAMLDWIKTGKVEPKILEKLRKARLSGVEQGPRVTALIVALIDQGRFDDARAELANLASAPKAHPHLEALNRYLRAKENAPDAGAPDGGTAQGSAEGENGDLDLALKEPDFRVRLQRAVQSLSRNELTKAQKLLRSVLAERPNDTEAITAMGDLHLRRGDLGQARTAYERALALNGSYLPAMAGAADVRWRSGDRANAIPLYRRILERVGDGPGYGQTAASRIKEYEGAKPADAPGEPARPSGEPSRNAP
jgi:tetratricopeptide (TPR) repeat protein